MFKCNLPVIKLAILIEVCVCEWTNEWNGSNVLRYKAHNRHNCAERHAPLKLCPSETWPLEHCLQEWKLPVLIYMYEIKLACCMHVIKQNFLKVSWYLNYKWECRAGTGKYLITQKIIKIKISTSYHTVQSIWTDGLSNKHNSKQTHTHLSF